MTGMAGGRKQIAAGVPCTGFEKKMKIAMVGQSIPQHQLAKELEAATSTISNIIYGQNYNEEARARIAKTLRIKL